MRQFTIALIAALAMSGQAFANKPMADGLVKKIDRQKATVVIAHGPLPNGMPAMTMAFRAKDPKSLSQLKEGQKIRFESEELNGVLMLNRFEPAQ